VGDKGSEGAVALGGDSAAGVCVCVWVGVEGGKTRARANVAGSSSPCTHVGPRSGSTPASPSSVQSLLACGVRRRIMKANITPPSVS